MHPGIIILIVVGVAGLVLLIVKLAKAAADRERQRRAALAEWASRNVFTIHPDDAHNLDARFAGLLQIGRGHDRYAFDVLARAEPIPAFLFQYHFKTWETRTVTRNGKTRTERYEATHHRRYLVVELAAAFPSLVVRPEGWFDKVAGFVGFDDVDFESAEFSARYFVKSSDRQFAYAVIHPQMMEWMLGADVFVQLESGKLLMNLSGWRFKHDAFGCYHAWANAVGFINRIPSFVWHDYGSRAEVRMPEADAAGAAITTIGRG